MRKEPRDFIFGLTTGLMVSLITFLTIPISVIQTYQYKEYILHWIDMDKEKFWKVFLLQQKTLHFCNLELNKKHNQLFFVLNRHPVFELSQF